MLQISIRLQYCFAKHHRMHCHAKWTQFYLTRRSAVFSPSCCCYWGRKRQGKKSASCAFCTVVRISVEKLYLCNLLHVAQRCANEKEIGRTAKMTEGNGSVKIAIHSVSVHAAPPYVHCTICVLPAQWIRATGSTGRKKPHQPNNAHTQANTDKPFVLAHTKNGESLAHICHFVHEYIRTHASAWSYAKRALTALTLPKQLQYTF